MSPGIISPAVSLTISPGTKFFISISKGRLSLITVTLVIIRFFSFSAVLTRTVFLNKFNNTTN